MNKLHEMIKIADIHASKIKLAMNEIKDIFPVDEVKVETLNQESFLFIELLVARFSKLQDSIGEKIIDAFFEEQDERVDGLTMIDKLNKLERLRIIDNVEIWKEMRDVRNYLTHEYPEDPGKTAKYLNVLYTLAPKLLEIVENIKKRSNM
jgi:hypothetical protein